ncbi:MAG: hypothetical protein IJD61_02420 [Clostridia bacterium]|nr:hypothetical protein [Clostridia bacterium]
MLLWKKGEGMIDFSKIKTRSAQGRHNLVTVQSIMPVRQRGMESPDIPELNELARRILQARRDGRPVILFMGAHVIKSGLSGYIIALMKEGFITHVATNGAGTIHDFELSCLGGTSEHVPTAIEDGTFGMWEETGAWMNAAICRARDEKTGYWRGIAAYMQDQPDKFPHRDISIAYQAAQLGVRATAHVSIGTDIIHQHPAADFAAIGYTSGEDFKLFADSVSGLEGGVFLNFGSAVLGPEVFLKALSISRNLGYAARRITTANFDLVDLGDYRCPIGDDDPNYYYRPRKNIVNRPTQNGGTGWHFVLNHKVSVPALYQLLQG